MQKMSVMMEISKIEGTSVIDLDQCDIKHFILHLCADP